MRVGVPRSLGYHYLYPFIRTFLDGLGILWLESPDTSERDLQLLSLCPTDEPCVSVKVAFAHAKRLLDQGACPLLVPTVVSLSSTSYCCPKMIGLPSMLKAGLGLHDSEMLCPHIDFRDNPRSWRMSWVHAARQIGITDKALVFSLLDKALAEWVMAREQASAVKSEDRWDTAVMGHAYVLNDVFGRRVMQELRGYGSVVTAEEVALSDADEALSDIPDGDKAWTIEARILGAALHLLRNRRVDRMVFVAAFSCGPASIIENYIGEEAERQGIPLLNLTVDEHTGEGGLVTRLEAFMDSRRRPAPFLSASTGVRAAATPASKVEAPGPLGIVNLGNLGIALEAMFGYMGVPVVRAPDLNEDMTTSGKELAPEFICSPMVTVLGQVRNLADKGIEKVLMIQGKGRCRLGWYSQVMQGILDRAGYKVKLLAFDSPFPWKDKGEAFIRCYKEAVGETKVAKAAGGLALAIRKLAVMDKAADILRELRAAEESRGSGDRLHSLFLKELREAGSFLGVEQTLRRFARAARDIARVKDDPLKVALIGEIYLVNEPFANKDVERVLGSLEERVWVRNNLGLSTWVNYHLLRLPGAAACYNKIARAARPYLEPDVGGHGRESVGEAALAKKDGLDGAIHVFPFTCMPEIIAQNVLVRLATDLDFPVLSLMITEQTAVQGLTTRIEAFCDLLAGRRKRAGVR